MLASLCLSCELYGTMLIIFSSREVDPDLHCWFCDALGSQRKLLPSLNRVLFAMSLFPDLSLTYPTTGVKCTYQCHRRQPSRH